MDTRDTITPGRERTSGEGRSKPGSREQFCAYLVAARQQRKLSLDAIAGVTRIPRRSLALLESGEFEKLPADVFVRGFLRSYAQCVGLDKDEITRRYAACGMDPAPVSSPMAQELQAALLGGDDSHRGSVRAVAVSPAVVPSAADDGMAASASLREAAETAVRDPAGTAASQRDADSARATESDSDAHQAEREQEARANSPRADSQGSPSAGGSAGGRRRRRRRRRGRKRTAAAGGGTAREPRVEAKVSADERVDPRDADVRDPDNRASADERESVTTTEPVRAADDDAAPASVDSAGTGPADASARDDARSDAGADVRESDSGTAPVRRPLPAPVLVIDDDNPDVAEEIQASRERDAEPSRRSFLPPSLLDRDDHGHRGALTVAVIILVIVATLTMSYLLRRPSSLGDGVTMAPGGDRHAVPASMTNAYANARPEARPAATIDRARDVLGSAAFARDFSL